MKIIINFFSYLALIVIVAVAAWNMNINSQNSKVSDISLVNNQALASSEDSGIIIYCKCNDGNLIGQNKKCKANGSNDVCAQSEAGGNIMCSNYDSNC